MTCRIAILSDVSGWHEARLREAFARRHAEARVVSLRACGFRIGSGGDIVVPGFDGALPDGVFVRTIAAGSFQQVTLRLSILHALRERGVPVYNDARVIERTVDKAMTSFLLARAKVPTVGTWVCESAEEAAGTVRREAAAGRKMVLKPLFGSQGRGLKLLDSVDDLPPPEDYDGVYYLQNYVPGDAPKCDWRVMVIGAHAVAAMQRRGIGWITNRAQGAECSAVDATGELARLAQRAARAVDASYAGVDIIRDPNGAYSVLEVNGIPAWQGLQQVCRRDLARHLADDLLAWVTRTQLEIVS